jgi:hypothetical protein
MKDPEVLLSVTEEQATILAQLLLLLQEPNSIGDGELSFNIKTRMREEFHKDKKDYVDLALVDKNLDTLLNAKCVVSANKKLQDFL